MAGYGLQFQPGIPQNGNGNGNGQRRRLQRPVQVLSTRLPQALLQGQGGMGQAARGNVVAQALAQLAGLPPGMQPPDMPPLPPSMGMQPVPGTIGAGGGFGGWGSPGDPADRFRFPENYQPSAPPPMPQTEVAQPGPDWGAWLRRHRDLNNGPESQPGSDVDGDLIGQLAGRLYR